jgi:hypothetical protein
MANILVNDSIALPPDLYWEDEFNWSPVAVQEDVSITGATIRQVSKRQSGRRFTLKSGTDTAWLTRAQLQALKTLEESLPESFPLVMGDGTAFNVAFDSGAEGQAIAAEALQPGKEPAPSDYFIATIKFTEV